MSYTDETLLEQMQIHDMEISERKALLGLSKEDEKLLTKYREFIEDNTLAIIDKFYDKLTSHEEINLIIGDADTLNRLKNAQKHYIAELFYGKYGVDYVNSRLRIGLVHKRIGVAPKYYLAATRLLKEILLSFLAKAVKDDITLKNITQALDKLLTFDTTFVFDTYIRSLVNEVENGKDKVESYARSLESIVAKRTEELKKLATRDELTSLYNYRAFHNILQKEIATSKRNSSTVTLAYFDVDNFKAINDTQGHKKGDEILKTVGEVVSGLVREVDSVCRYGGDEFCVVFSGAATDDAVKVCERLESELEDRLKGVSLSIGIAHTGPEEFDTADELIKKADTRMYKAKNKQGFQIITK